MSLTVRMCAVIGCAFALASACGGPEELDGEVTSLVVLGVIEDAAGVPVPGAVVHVGWQPTLCNEPQPFPPDTTDAAGAFSITAWGWGTYSEACVQVRAEPPEGAALQQAQVLVDHVPLQPKDGPDTLSVRLTLNPT